MLFKQAIQNKADLIIFSELSICGYSPKDLLNQDDFMDFHRTRYLEIY